MKRFLLITALFAMLPLLGQATTYRCYKTNPGASPYVLTNQYKDIETSDALQVAMRMNFDEFATEQCQQKAGFGSNVAAYKLNWFSPSGTYGLVSTHDTNAPKVIR